MRIMNVRKSWKFNCQVNKMKMWRANTYIRSIYKQRNDHPNHKDEQYDFDPTPRCQAQYNYCTKCKKKLCINIEFQGESEMEVHVSVREVLRELWKYFPQTSLSRLHEKTKWWSTPFTKSKNELPYMEFNKATQLMKINRKKPRNRQRMVCTTVKHKTLRSE